jgi:hypothetical protein
MKYMMPLILIKLLISASPLSSVPASVGEFWDYLQKNSKEPFQYEWSGVRAI